LGASPIKVSWINAAARLGLQPLRVGLALQYLRCMRKRATVLFSQITANAFEIDAKNKYRGTKALEKAGLIRIEKRRRGSSPLITIVEVDEETI
jgi:hypothetical protein